VFRAATERAGLRLKVDCPNLAEPAYVDRDMWEKIVLNLISNAFKFTFEGEIEVSLRTVNGAAELRVRDTGVGIPADEFLIGFIASKTLAAVLMKAAGLASRSCRSWSSCTEEM
jgi:K+-sensing histidine kinase KdpD